MTYEEMVRNISLAGLNVREFADLIKILPSSVTNFKSEKNKIPKTLFIITALIRDMKQAGIDYRKTIEEIDFDYKRRKPLKEKK